MLQVRRDMLVQYTKVFDYDIGRVDGRSTNVVKQKVREKAYNSLDISRGSRKRLNRCLDIFMLGTPVRWMTDPYSKKRRPFKAAFITLTIPEDELVPAKWAARYLMEPFLARLRRAYPGVQYIWKRELQVKSRLQVHYHLIVNQFIHYHWINRSWNQILASKGLLEKYWKKYGDGRMPNSTDVKSVRSDNNILITRYLQKYFLKNLNEETQKKIRENPILEDSLKGRWWDCSEGIKKMKYCEVPLLAQHMVKLQELFDANQIDIKIDEDSPSPRYFLYKLKKVGLDQVFNDDQLFKIMDFYEYQFKGYIDTEVEYFNYLNLS